VLYLHHDQQGSTRLLTGSTGKTEATFTYDVYGNQTGHTGTATTPLGYDAQYTSSDTGLIYLRAREYDPATAQFLSVDPRIEETNAVYEYAKDDPLAVSDPTGTEPLGAAIFGAQELAILGKGYRELAGYFYLGQAALEVGFKEAGEALGVTPGAYADYLLKWGLYLEKVAASLAHAKPGAADAYYVTERGFTVGGWAFPTKIGTAYAWYRGSSENGAELFWAGRYGWQWKIHPNVP
jgi:RHS repeat-associated protein